VRNPIRSSYHGPEVGLNKPPCFVVEGLKGEEAAEVEGLGEETRK